MDKIYIKRVSTYSAGEKYPLNGWVCFFLFLKIEVYFSTVWRENSPIKAF
jgi:hypothetical protein